VSIFISHHVIPVFCLFEMILLITMVADAYVHAQIAYEGQNQWKRAYVHAQIAFSTQEPQFRKPERYVLKNRRTPYGSVHCRSSSSHTSFSLENTITDTALPALLSRTLVLELFFPPSKATPSTWLSILIIVKCVALLFYAQACSSRATTGHE
jgi:hypothetical protein